MPPFPNGILPSNLSPTQSRGGRRRSLKIYALKELVLRVVGIICDHALGLLRDVRHILQGMDCRRRLESKLRRRRCTASSLRSGGGWRTRPLPADFGLGRRDKILDLHPKPTLLEERAHPSLRTRYIQNDIQRQQRGWAGSLLQIPA